MKKKVLLMAALFFLSGSLADSEMRSAIAQPSIGGTWLFDLSGVDKGGAVITFGGNTITGYGFGLFLGDFDVAGTYTVDGKGVIRGSVTETERWKLYRESRQNAHQDIPQGPGRLDPEGNPLSSNRSDYPSRVGRHSFRIEGDFRHVYDRTDGGSPKPPFLHHFRIRYVSGHRAVHGCGIGWILPDLQEYRLRQLYSRYLKPGDRIWNPERENKLAYK